MKPYLTILASALALTASAETVQQLRVINLSGGNDGLAWIDKQGNAHKFDSTNTVSILYASNIVGIINYSNLPATSPTNWSTFHAVSDLDIAGNDIQSVNVIMAGEFQTMAGGYLSGSAMGNALNTSTFNVGALDPFFGIHNGEPAGVGSDINLVSDNGGIKTVGALGFDNTGSAHFHDGTTWFGRGNFIDFYAMFGGDAYMLATSPVGVNAGYTANRGDSTAYASFDVITGENLSSGWSMQMHPGDSDWHLFDRTAGIDAINVSHSGVITLTPNSLGSGATYAFNFDGADFNGSPLVAGDISTSGSFWAQGSQGGSGFSVLDADGVTTHAVISGIIMP